MATHSTRPKAALALAGSWLLTLSLSTLAVAVLLLSASNWHAVRDQLQQLSLWQSWISIAACAGLLVISRKKHSENQQEWAQGALLIYVIGGLLTALVLHHGVLTQFLAQHESLLRQAQVLVLLALHWLCAVLALRSLWRFRQAG